jgi:DNA gyrase subunit B
VDFKDGSARLDTKFFQHPILTRVLGIYAKVAQYNNQKYTIVKNEKELGKDISWQELKESIGKLSDRSGVSLQRYKGLGEMTAEQLWETTMNPATRTMLKVDIEDAAKADSVFQMLMGGEVPPRKSFIQAHARSARLDI